MNDRILIFSCAKDGTGINWAFADIDAQSDALKELLSAYPDGGDWMVFHSWSSFPVAMGEFKRYAKGMAERSAAMCAA